MMSSVCWCGSRELQIFSPDYWECGQCGTLVVKDWPPAERFRVVDDEKDYYGKNYVTTGQDTLPGPLDLESQAIAYLQGRCVHWMKIISQLEPPPARILEVGSSHGAFLGFLRWAGYEAEGVDLSPSMAKFAHDTFRVKTAVGWLEDQGYPNGSYDLLVLNDVLEHLPTPLETLRECWRVLKPEGVLLIQTPCRPDKLSYQDLIHQGHRFLEMLKPAEHVYLFSRFSVDLLASRLGARVKDHPAYFPHYDMYLSLRQTVVKHRETPLREPWWKGMLQGSPLSWMSVYLDLASKYHALEERLSEAEADRAIRLRVIERIEKDKRKLLENRGKLLFALLPYRWRRLLGYRFVKLLKKIKRPRARAVPTTSEGRLPGRPLKVAVDLTPLLPGGDNGGAKVAVLALLRELGRIPGDLVYVLLTAASSHEELKVLEGPRMTRHLVKINAAPPQAAFSLTHFVSHRMQSLLQMLPPSALNRAKGAYQAFRFRRIPRRPNPFLRHLGADLLFCPFSAGFFYDPTIPMVSMVYDLQYADYPQFFSPEERLHRERYLRETARHSRRLICISDFVRGTVIEKLKVPRERVKTVHIQTSQRLTPLPECDVSSILGSRGLGVGGYLFYPANYWPHKNHRMLLTAYNIYCHRHPESTLQLVLTGAPGPGEESVREAVGRMGLSHRVHLLGYVSDRELSALLGGCRAMIFPSLYEGFGMPVLEAMAFGKPVLCSGSTSLPEITDKSALHFNPKKPLDIVAAIEALDQEPVKISQLAKSGPDRAALFSDPGKMALGYVAIFNEVLGGAIRYSDALHGIYPDGWMGERMVVTFSPSPQDRHLEMVFSLPGFSPQKEVTACLENGLRSSRQTYRVGAGGKSDVRYHLPPKGGFLEISVSHTFQPKALGMNEDTRFLGLQCESCRIVSSAQSSDLLTPPGPVE